MHAAPPTRQRRKEARPLELLDAALELFAEKGFAATRSEEVAARAGVAKGTLYLYYPSKEELLKAVVRHNLSNLISEGAELLDGYTGPMAELLPLLMHTWWDRVGNTRASAIFKIMMSEARNFPDIARFYEDEVVAPAKRLLSRTLTLGVSRGEFRAVPLEETTAVLLSPMIFMSLNQHSFNACDARGDGSRVDPSSVIAVHIEMAMRSLRPDAPVKPVRQRSSRRPASPAAK